MIDSTLDLAVIGNGRTAALVEPTGRIVWWCLPRYDGDPVFCRLLADKEEKGFTDVVLDGQVENRSEYLRNTAIVVTELSDGHGGAVRITDFAPRFHHYGRTFRPPQLVRLQRKIQRPRPQRVRHAGMRRIFPRQSLVELLQAPLRFAGGNPRDDETSLDEFLVQAREYEMGGNIFDTALKFLNVAFQTHPFATVRAAELQRWMESGAYERIIGGEYPRRGGADQRPLSDDYAEAAAHYREHARGAVDQVAAAVKDLSEIVSGAFRNRGGTPPGESPPK